jgi:hypothetical protein
MSSEHEIRKAWERDRAYHKRIAKIIPVAFAIVLLLFLTSDQVSLTELEKHVGWKGEMRVLPEISIIPDDAPFDAIQSDGLPPVMTSMDLDLTEGPDLPDQKLVDKKDPDDAELPELSHEDLLRITTRLRQRSVPYSNTYVILKMVEPEYPIYELENEIEGSVTVELFVNESGRVEVATVLSSIGPESFKRHRCG